MHVADLGGRRGHESGEGVDELAGLVEIRLGRRVVGEPHLDGGRAHEVHGGRRDDLDRRDLRDVACRRRAGSSCVGESLIRGGSAL